MRIKLVHSDLLSVLADDETPLLRAMLHTTLVKYANMLIDLKG
jgi:hypothetical protein